MQSVFPATALDFWFNVGAHVTFLHGVIPAYGRSIDGAFWSLSTEWQFYLLLPLLIWAVRRWGLIRPLAVAAAISLLYCFALIVFGVAWPNPPLADPLAYRFIEFGAGMAVAVILRSERRLPWIWTIATVFLIAAVALHLSGGGVLEAPLWAVAFGGVIYLGARRGVVQWISLLKPIRWIGRLSYSIYLVHGAVFMLIATVTTHLSLPLAARLMIFEGVGIPFALFAGVLLHRVVEQPAVRWAHRGRIASGRLVVARSAEPAA